MKRPLSRSVFVFLILLFSGTHFVFAAAGDEKWDPMLPGTNGAVNAFAVSAYNLYMGGNFTIAGNVNANRVAKWNGEAWSALGSGMNGQVNVLATRGSTVYAGGAFTQAGGVAANYIAIWNGTVWTAMQTGLNGIVHDIWIAGDMVYVVGEFTKAGSLTVNHVAVWDGNNWSAIGAGLNGTAYTVMLKNSTLYVGGVFTKAGSVNAECVAKWTLDDGWQNLNSDFHGKWINEGTMDEVYEEPLVYDLLFHGDTLIVGGFFRGVNGASAYNIAAFNTSYWLGLKGGLHFDNNEGYVKNLLLYEDDLYVAGRFTSNTGLNAPYVARWSDKQWESLGSGLNNTARTMIKLENYLYVGGTFSEAGHKVCNNLAKWYMPESPVVQPFLQYSKITNGSMVNNGGKSMGCAWGDYDNDGHPDLFIANDDNTNNFLYHNNGDGTFTRVDALSGNPIVTDGGHSWSGSWGDYDNDGWVDLYVANYGHANFLYHNEGNGTFSRVTTGEIVNDDGYSSCGTWGDYDNDGDLDMFVANANGENNALYKNNGNGSFSKVISGFLVIEGGNSVAASWADYDNDGDLDLFVANREGENNFLYTNNGNGTFAKKFKGSIVTDGGDSRTCSWGDYDRDGHQDLFVGNQESQNFLYRNNGDGTFSRMTGGIPMTEMHDSRGSAWGDINNDGFLDIVVTNQGAYSYVYLNNGDLTFSRFYLDSVNARGAAFCDINNDGFLDLCVAVDSGNNQVYIYTEDNSNHWFSLVCKGNTSSFSGLGAQVAVLAVIDGDETWQIQEISGLTGFGGQTCQRAHFGLGNAARIDSIIVRWPSGVVWDTSAVARDQFFRLREYYPYSNITISTKPDDYTVSVDSDENDGPLTYLWRKGQTHEVGVDSFYTNAEDGRAFFDEWNNGGNRMQTYLVPNNDDSLTARFIDKFWLDLTSPYGTTDPDDDWYVAGDTIDIEVTDYVQTTTSNDSLRHKFLRWTGTGTGAYSGAANPASVVMRDNITQQAVWTIQYPLTLVYNDEIGDVIVEPSGWWQYKDSTVTLIARPVSGFYFGGWGGSVNGANDTIVFTMDTSHVVYPAFFKINEPPVVSMHDSTFVEDDTLVISTDILKTWITDAEQTYQRLTITVAATSNYFHTALNADGLSIWADRNFNGDGWLVVQARDSVNAVTKDTMFCTITAKNDPPGPFDLAAPADGFIAAEDTIMLSWFHSANVDTFMHKDVIGYAVFFGRQGRALDSLTTVTDTTFMYIHPADSADGIYEWRIKAIDVYLESVWSTSKRTIDIVIQTDVPPVLDAVPETFALYQNYPNPFNPATVIAYDLPVAARVELTIYNIRGSRVATLVNTEQAAGSFRVVWDGRNQAGRFVSSGIYIYRIRAEQFTMTRKMLFVR